MKKTPRYFVNATGWAKGCDVDYIMIDTNGRYYVVRLDGQKRYDPTGTLGMCLQYVKDGTWKEITKEEAMHTGNRVLKAEEIKPGMTIIGHSTFNENQDRSYIGSTYEVKEVQLPFIFAKEVGGCVIFKDDIRTIDTRRYFFMERAGSKPFPTHEEFAQLQRQFDEAILLSQAHSKRASQLNAQCLQSSLSVATLQNELRRANEAHQNLDKDFTNVVNQLTKAKKELEKYKKAKVVKGIILITE